MLKILRLAGFLALLSTPAMAADNLWEYDATTPGNNTSIGAVSTAEGWAPSLVNNAIRELLSQIRKGLYNQGSDIASAATTSICATGTSIYAKVTGTTTITGLGTANAGCWRIITFTGALTLTHNATSLILPGGESITTAAGDMMVAMSEGSGNWRVISYVKASGLPIVTDTQSFQVAITPETGAVVSGATQRTFRMPYAFTITAVRASLATTQTSGSILTVDINEGGATVLSTKITIDNSEKTSTTAVTAPVVSDSALADDAEITIDVDQIGDGTAKGLIVTIIGRRT